MSNNGHIEARHVITEKRQLVDVRPWSERAAEKLYDGFTFLIWTCTLIYLGWSMPVLLPLTIAVFLTIYFLVRGLKSYLPYRYPSYAKKIPREKKGKGILFLGAVRSESPLEHLKQCWLTDDDLRKHWLIMGSTGSGKSETLKGIFYNALCWGSGFFCADGKADNKLPTDGYTMLRAFGRDDDVLSLNFLLGGKTPQQVARSRRRRSNGTNPFSSADADTLIQMGANLLPKAEGDGKSWQEKALAVWRAEVTALCYKRDTQNMPLSVETIIDYLALNKIEELYIEGYKEFTDTGSWSYGFTGIKAYLESGCPAYQVEKLLAKNGLGEAANQPPPPPAAFGRAAKAAKSNGREFEQDAASYEQHGYRVGQLMPVLTLLDKTYSYIFRAPFSEIDMIDVALHNRILFLLIPSLEKSAQEAENLGKLAIACLRVMMARNLGADTEGTAAELIESKATEAPYPYIVALDELGYYFSDGIAVMFAQARSLGISMIAAAQDLEKLTEGTRQAEAGAMTGNSVNKVFMKIDDPGKTLKLVQDSVGKVSVATYAGYELSGSDYKREKRLHISERDLVAFKELQSYKEGQAVLNTQGHTERVSTFFMGDWQKRMNNTVFHINRFMQVYPPSDDDLVRLSLPVAKGRDTNKLAAGARLMQIIKGDAQPQNPPPELPVFAEFARIVAHLNTNEAELPAAERGIFMYLALERWLNGAQESQAQPSAAGPSGEGASIDMPSTAEIFMNNNASMAQMLDEHGLPDPLSLLRKPLSEVVDTTAPHAPRLASPSRSIPIAPPSKPDAASGVIGPDLFSAFDLDINAQDNIDDILLGGRAQNKPALDEQPAQWVSSAVAKTHQMISTPRSNDGSVVGLSQESMEGLEQLEEVLGNVNPKQAASTMQKVAAAHLTPITRGQGKQISDDEIEDFFKSL